MMMTYIPYWLFLPLMAFAAIGIITTAFIVYRLRYPHG